MKITPTRRILEILCIPFVFISLGFLSSSFFALGFALDIVLGTVFAYDLIKTARGRHFDARVGFPGIFSIGKKNTLTIYISNKSQRSFSGRLALDIPGSWEDFTSETDSILSPLRAQSFDMILRPTRRGRFHLTKLHLVYFSLFMFFY